MSIYNTNLSFPILNFYTICSFTTLYLCLGTWIQWTLNLQSLFLLQGKVLLFLFGVALLKVALCYVLSKLFAWALPHRFNPIPLIRSYHVECLFAHVWNTPHTHTEWEREKERESEILEHKQRRCVQCSTLWRET